MLSLAVVVVSQLLGSAWVEARPRVGAAPEQAAGDRAAGEQDGASKPAARNAGDAENQGPTPAPPDKLEQLLARYRSAQRDASSTAVCAVLRDLQAHDNPEFIALAKDALAYRASKRDKREAESEGEELGTTSKREIAELLTAREAAVQALGARLLGELPERQEGRRAVDQDLQGQERAQAATDGPGGGHRGPRRAWRSTR